MNSPPRASDLSEIHATVWSGLEAAPADPDHPWRLPVLATQAADGPRARTVVLRSAGKADRTLIAHTDVRSPKVRQLAGDNRVVLLFWDPRRSVQASIQGAATVHTDDAVAGEQWTATPALSRRGYLGPLPPGTPTVKPNHNLPDDIVGRQPTEDELQPGRENFCVIRVLADTIDWLQLDRSGNLRARFEYGTGGLIANWIAP